MSRTITVQFQLDVPEDDYDYAADGDGRIEAMADVLLDVEGVSLVRTGGPSGSGFIPPTPVPLTPEEQVQQVCAAIRAKYPTASTFFVSSGDQGMFGYWLRSVRWDDGSIVDEDSGEFEAFAEEVNDDWLMDLRWGAFGDKNADTDFDVDITTGRIIR